MTLVGLAGALLLWGAPAAGVSPPSVSAGAFWTAEERPVRLRLLSPAARQTGQGVFLQATIALDESCVYPGPLLEVRDVPAGSPRQFRARVWRRHGEPCNRIARLVDQPIHVWTEAAGTVRLAASESAVITVKISGPNHEVPLDDRPRPCRFDGDCWVTDVCVPRKGDPSGVGICGQICGSNLDCAGGRCDTGPGIVGVCKNPSATCDERHPCGWGQVCTGRRGDRWCEWPTELNASSRGACATDGDCGAGLKCFKRDGAAAPRGRCELLCSSGLMACTGAHQCSGEGICEWLGE